MGARRTENPTGTRDGAPRFGMTDEPPSTGEVQDMNRGVDAPGDEGSIHVIPAAVGAVAPVVNFPNDCDVNRLDAADKTAEQNRDGDGIPDDVVRVRFSKTKFEKAWAKDDDADKWTELFEELRNTTAFPVEADDPCAKPIIRVVRFDDSGTTFTLKNYLDRLNGGRDWVPGFTGTDSTAKTRRWPNATFGARADCPPTGNPPAPPSGPGSEPDNVDQLTSGCSNGNGSLVSKVISTDGSIGYSDISTARTASPSLAITPENNDNDTYWTQVQNGSDAFTEPTADTSFGFRTDGASGSNCQNTSFTGVPASTLGDWSNASGVNSPQGYGVCTLTYGLVFDDYALPYATQTSGAVAEEQKARTVKDYWTDIVSDGGQAVLFGKDYAPLPGGANPSGILGIARAGVNAVGWDKSASGGGGGTPGGGTPGGGTPGGGNSTTPPPPAATPSNRFSITRTTINSRRGTATISVRVPGRGTIQALSTARNRGKRFRVGGSRVGVSRAGTYRLTIRPGRTAKRILKKKRKLRTSVRMSYRPTGGTTRNAAPRTVTLKLRKRARRR